MTNLKELEFEEERLIYRFELSFASANEKKEFNKELSETEIVNDWCALQQLMDVLKR